MRKIILFCGWGWSASSPLIYTFQRKIKYAHFGYTKNFLYLKKPYINQDGELVFTSSSSVPFIIKKQIEGTWENFKSFEPSSHRMNLPQDLEPLRDFPVENLKELITGEPTISKYMNFHIALHDHVVSKGYKSVGNCGYKRLYTGPNVSRMRIQATREFQKAIMSEFEVKCLFITRDPIRRAFGQYMNAIQRVTDAYSPEGQEYNRYKLPYQLDVINYLADIDYCCSVYGEENVHVTVMEELWEGDGTAKKELSQFLDHPIDELYKNLYSPDRGHLVEYDKDVPCQAFAQNLYELTSSMYYVLKKKYQWVYDSWKERYGSLPLYWGEPIDYQRETSGYE